MLVIVCRPDSRPQGMRRERAAPDPEDCGLQVMVMVMMVVVVVVMVILVGGGRRRWGGGGGDGQRDGGATSWPCRSVMTSLSQHGHTMVTTSPPRCPLSRVVGPCCCQ